MMKFPPVEPFATGNLQVDDDTHIYWETSGNPRGRPVIYLHGGPGSGASPGYRRLFDPEKFHIISFDQRGCGRSRPLATDPSVELKCNTTEALISDIEKLRVHLQIEQWLLYGGSWGTTLALAYAQEQPERVSAMILAAVTTTSSEEVEWITEQMKNIFPREWDEFARASQAKPGQRLIDAYYELIVSPDPKIREAAVRAWCQWEDVHVSLTPKSIPFFQAQELEYQLLFATLVIHYWRHSGFLNGEKKILNRMQRLAKIPGVLIHGKLDVSSPLRTAWELHKAWPLSELIVLENNGHGGEEMALEVLRAGNRLFNQLSN